MVFTQQVNPNMTDFIIKKLPYDLSSHAGLAFIGKYLKHETRGHVSHFPFHFSFSASYSFTTRLTVELERANADAIPV